MVETSLSQRSARCKHARKCRGRGAWLIALWLVIVPCLPANARTRPLPTLELRASNPFGLTDVGSYAAPAFADIDGDGDLDAFVGEFYGGVSLFENTGGLTSPAFAAPLANPLGLTGVASAAVPRFADIDGDGDFDAFVGAASGDTYFFRNTGSVTSPAFGLPLTNPFGLAAVGTYAAPSFVDIDGDGDLDVFVGTYDGDVAVFVNTGTAIAPAFATTSANPFGLTPTSGFAVPCFADMDEDGDADALVWDDAGIVRYSANTSSATSPAFAASVVNPFGFADAGAGSAGTLADIDGDGDLDAFVGNASGDTVFTENTSGGAQSPAFMGPSLNPFGLATVPSEATPGLGDLDGDGDLDALYGDANGDLAFLENTGTIVSPAFALPVANPFGLTHLNGGPIDPHLVDVDADGDLDLFVGTANGGLSFFGNTGSAVTPAFGAASANPFGLAGVPNGASPCLADLDGDGDRDALVGSSDGNLRLFENTGSVKTPAFAAPSTNPFGLADVGASSQPTLVDVDDDGDLDACVGEATGKVLVFRNDGSATSPAFASPAINGFGLAAFGNHAAPHFADIDGDGQVDGFVGSGDGATSFLRNVTRQRVFSDGFETGTIEEWSDSTP